MTMTAKQQRFVWSQCAVCVRGMLPVPDLQVWGPESWDVDCFGPGPEPVVRGAAWNPCFLAFSHFLAQMSRKQRFTLVLLFLYSLLGFLLSAMSGMSVCKLRSIRKASLQDGWGLLDGRGFWVCWYDCHHNCAGLLPSSAVERGYASGQGDRRTFSAFAV